jgi:hypothetical protein
MRSTLCLAVLLAMLSLSYAQFKIPCGFAYTNGTYVSLESLAGNYYFVNPNVTGNNNNYPQPAGNISAVEVAVCFTTLTLLFQLFISLPHVLFYFYILYHSTHMLFYFNYLYHFTPRVILFLHVISLALCVTTFTFYFLHIYITLHHPQRNLFVHSHNHF